MEIDELQLDITVKDEGKSSEKIKKLATAISRLDRVVKAFDTGKMSRVFTKLTNSITPFVAEVKKASKAIIALSDLTKTIGLEKAQKMTKELPAPKTEVVETGASGEVSTEKRVAGESQQIKSSTEQASANISQINNKLDLLKARLESVKNELQKSGLSENKLLTLKNQELSLVERIAKEEEKVKKQREKEAEEQASIVGEEDNSNKKVEKKSGIFSKLIRSIGRIALYRAIRSILKEITQSLNESISAIAKINPEFKSTMTSIQSSLSKVKTSLGVSLYQGLIVLEPVINSISNGIVNLANSIAKVSANLRGVSEYTKINTEYMKEYQSTVNGTLLSFDTFTTLGSNQTIDYSKMFEEADDALDKDNFSYMEESIKGTFKMLGNVVDVIKEILPLVTPLVSLVNKIANTILPILIDTLKTIVPIVEPIIEHIVWAFEMAMNMLNAIVKFVRGDFTGAFESLKDVFRSLGNVFVTIAEAIVNSLIGSLNILAKPINWIGRIFGASSSFAQLDYVSFKRFAQGGGFNSADLFYANENGKTELVASSNSGGGAVMNMEQLRSAIYEGMTLAMANQGSGSSAIYLDGNKVGSYIAGNNGFRNEANRRNTGLNWK